MRTLARAGVLAVLCAALTGCVFLEGVDEGEGLSPDQDRVYALLAADGHNLPMCRWIEQSLRDKPAVFFTIPTLDNYVALSSDGRLLCVDEPAVVLRAGVIPWTNPDEPSCSFCDGTPLPASAVIELAKKFDEQRTDL